MSYTLTIAPRADYLHVLVTGVNSRQNVASYLADILQACAARNCFRVLIEERLEGPRLDILDVFDLASSGARQPPRVDAVAFVDVNAEGDLMKFAEDVAVNRGMPVRVFLTVRDAEEWLQHVPAHGGFPR